VLACGVGLTVTAAVAVEPSQPRPPNVNVGVTVILPEIGEVPLLVPVKLAMLLPVPVAPRPIDILSFDHANELVPPVASELNVIVEVDVPLHTTWSPLVLACGVGLTVTAALAVVPTQLTLFVNVGVTVILPDIGDVPLFVPVNPAMLLPVPVAPRPIDMLSFDHAKELLPPVASELNVIAEVDVPLHTI